MIILLVCFLKLLLIMVAPLPIFFLFFFSVTYKKITWKI